MDTKELLLTTCTSSQHFSVCAWDYASGNAIHHYKNGGQAPTNALALLDQDYVLTAEADKPILNTWLLNGHEPCKETKLVLPGPATCLTLCPFSTYLAVGIGTKLYVWHLSSGKLMTVQEKHYQPISAVRFSSDGVYLCVGGQDGALVTYNFPQLVGFQNNLLVHNEAGQAEPLYAKSDHSRAITGLHVGVFGAKARLVSISSDQACFVYSLSDGDMLLSLVFPEELSAVVLSDTGWDMFVGSYSGSIFQIKLSDPPRTAKHHVDRSSSLSFVGHKQKINCLAVSFDGSVLVSGSADCTVHVWQVQSRKILRTLEHKGAITNLLFVLNYDRFFVHAYKPGLVVRKLERTFDPTDRLFDVCVNQDYELEVDEDCLLEERIGALLKENRFLRAANKQLYDASVMSIGKKLKLGK